MAKRSPTIPAPTTPGKAKAKPAAKKKGAGKAKVEAAPFDDGIDTATDEAMDTESGGGSGRGKHLVIVESPAKAKTINKYLGSDYKVLASVGHVRDLPSRNPKGVKNPVPGVDLEHDFAPTYGVLEGKGKVIAELKKSAKHAKSIWFATDPDREGEAIAWHLAEELGVDPRTAKRVEFNAITKAEVHKAFEHPRAIDMDRVNAQQARRVLDRIVGFQVSPLLWKNVARGLSAGRVQSVAVRLIVEREREIKAFTPDEYYQITANFTSSIAKAAGLATAWVAEQQKKNEKGEGLTVKELSKWLAENGGLRAELVDVGGEKFDLGSVGDASEATAEKIAARAKQLAEIAGMKNVQVATREDAKGKGPAKFVRTITGTVDTSTKYKVTGIETRRTTTRPSAPFITSTLQQAGSTRLGYGAKRTMAAAQQLYQGVDIPGEGPVALITYMRTDSTRISGEALTMVREYIPKAFGDKYLPEKPNFFGSTNKDAQDAHEAIRPTSMAYPPNAKLKAALKPDLFRLYQIIWERFVACQMVPAEWESVSAMITGGTDPKTPLTFKATGRTLIFDGHYKATGVPQSAEEQILPKLDEGTPMAPFYLNPQQKFTQPPPRYSEASLIKMLESEGIGRPSTYASIISVIQDRKYAEQIDRRFYSTDIGEVVTDMLIQAFPDLLDLGYTRDMEKQLDRVEEEHIDWVDMLHKFYGPFKKRLGEVEGTLTHAKAETTPAPYTCPTCGSPTVYRLGKSGKFLSCSTYPDCKYAAPVDREGVPRQNETTNVACHLCGRGMTLRTGKFGKFLSCSGYGDKANPCKGILKIDRGGKVVAPSTPPFRPEPEIPCAKCGKPNYLRPGKYGPWLGCSNFPKCRGRGDFKGLDEKVKAGLLKELEAHQKAHPPITIRNLEGTPLTGFDGKPLPTAPRLDQPEETQTADVGASEE
ncbi:MAG: type I DNA topoisomerase [Phycisphaerales bacterium]|nr:type I DNA topoisomerase [Phycisphaerales bacterium]